jgi:hypothetical protein
MGGWVLTARNVCIAGPASGTAPNWLRVLQAGPTWISEPAPADCIRLKIRSEEFLDPDVLGRFDGCDSGENRKETSSEEK